MNTDKWVVLGQQECKWCKKVVGLLLDHGIEFTYYDVDNWDQLKDFMKKSGLTTVPKVFVNGELIGGYEDTESYLEWH